MIVSSSNRPWVLFNTLNLVLKVPEAVCLKASTDVCEKFLQFFSPESGKHPGPHLTAFI